jgi:hypothetical protein
MTAPGYEMPLIKPQSRGTPRGSKLQVQCTFDPDTFQQIRTMAVNQKISFAAAIRLLVEWGLEAE